MPFTTFAILIAAVIAAAGVTIALVLQGGFPLAAVGLAALVLSLLPGLRRWR